MVGPNVSLNDSWMRIVRPVTLVDYEKAHGAYIFLQPTQHFAKLNVFTARLKGGTCTDEARLVHVLMKPGSVFIWYMHRP